MLGYDLQKATGLWFSEPSKVALQLADKFEQRILGTGWQDGYILGPEGELAEEYKSTYQTVRQALRVLEWRDLGRMRRGADGGLLVHTPSMSATGRLLIVHLTALGVSASDIENARLKLVAALPPQAIQARTLTQLLFSKMKEALLEQAENSLSAATSMNNRALRIALKIVQSKTASNHSNRAEIGSIEHLCASYSAGRPIIVQALRILESLDLVRSSRGRGGGFRFCEPSPAAIVKAVFPHFIAHRLDLNACRDIIWTINQISATSAARNPTKSDDLKHLKQRLSIEAFVAGNSTVQVEILRYLADNAGDSVLHTLIRCLWYYDRLLIETTSLPRITAPKHRAMIGKIIHSTHDLVDSIYETRPDKAANAVLDCSLKTSQLYKSLF